MKWFNGKTAGNKANVGASTTVNGDTSNPYSQRRDIVTITSRKLSMEERIQAFYQQSGGPQNPEIDRILREHLKYGKDHGTSGVIETLKDAIRTALLQDKSLKILYDKFYERKDENEERRIRKFENFQQMGREIRAGIEVRQNERVTRLEAEMKKLNQMVTQLIDKLEQQGVTNRS